MIENFSHQNVLLRVDFNVPMDSEFNISDDSRMRASMPTIRHLLDHHARVIILSHRGRPGKKLLDNGQMDYERFSLKYLVHPLSMMADTKVHFANILDKKSTEVAAKTLNDGEILLLENTRFYPGEKKGELTWAEWLASLGSFYVNDAFGTAHRNHASTAVIASFFDKKHKSAGLLIEKELNEAKKLIHNPEKPYTAIIGGAKVSDKIQLIDQLLGQVDHLIIGGGMAYTFIKAQGGEIGRSLCELDQLSLATNLLELAKRQNTKIYLPTDSIIADDFSTTAQSKICSSHEIPDGWMGLDIGPVARKDFGQVIKNSETIFWNGPMGVFEMSAFSEGTKAIATAVSEATKLGAYSSIGGGDSVAAVVKFGYANQVSFMSTGGGAMLQLLEGGTLPGIKALDMDSETNSSPLS